MGKSLTPMFSLSNVMNRIDRFHDERIRIMAQSLAAIGETFVNAARETDTYKDRTSNLRGSIGYIVAHDGDIKVKNLKGSSTGKSNAEQVAREVLSQNKEGFVLIGFAGMEYAASVESKGYDVITGSVPAAEILLKFLKEELGL